MIQLWRRLSGAVVTISADSEESKLSMSSDEQETLLSSWRNRSSNSEQDQQDRAERMVTDAIKNWSAFDGITPAVYTKGSYPNNTNVRTDSDVDVAVECRECNWSDYSPGVTPKPVVGVDLYRSLEYQQLAYGGNERTHRCVRWRCRRYKRQGGAERLCGKGQSAERRRRSELRFYRWLDSDRITSHVGSCVWDTDHKQIVNWP